MSLQELRQNSHLIDKTIAFIDVIKRETIYYSSDPNNPPELAQMNTELAFSEFVAEMKKNILDLSAAQKEMAALREQLAATEAKLNQSIATEFSIKMENESLVLENEILKDRLRQLEEVQDGNRHT